MQKRHKQYYRHIITKKLNNMSQNASYDPNKNAASSTYYISQHIVCEIMIATTENRNIHIIIIRFRTLKSGVNMKSALTLFKNKSDCCSCY